MKLRYYFSTISLLLIFVQALFAAPSGKITGTVTDAETGQPLPGVNVIVEGTDYGAATNQDGYYVILNVPPGTYTVHAMMIGYANYIVSDVRVEIGLTTRVDVPMQTQAISGQQVEVVAKRPVVNKDVSQSRMSVTAEEITNLPVENVEQVVGLQAGIEGLSVRGGSANETSFLLDGLSLNDERSNNPYTNISVSSIKEIQIETGGFNAEYGNLRSGLITAVTKDGSANKYSGTVTIHYSAPAPKNFGPSPYSPNSYFLRPYMDPAVAWTGTANGAWDQYTRLQYPSFSGWEDYAKSTLEDSDPTNDLTPEGAKRRYEYLHRRNGEINIPDYIVDFGVGGPMPIISEPLGNLRFYLSHRRQQDAFLYPLSTNAYRDNITQLKLTSDITDAMKLKFTGLYGAIHSATNTNWDVPTGHVVQGTYELASLASAEGVLYIPDYFNPTSIYRNMEGIEFTHQISNRTLYELSVQKMTNIYKTDTLAHRDTSKVYEIIPGYYMDEAPDGYWGYGSGSPMGGWMGLAFDRSVNSTYTISGDLTSQVNEINQVKTGAEIIYNTYQIHSYTYSPSMSTWSRSQQYNRYPFRAGAYLQDKLEVSEFIMNAGLRLDYSDPNGQWYDLQNPYDQVLSEKYGDQIDSLAAKKPAESHIYLSPRLGVSHPITVNSKLYFNYGHFRQLPASSYRYELQQENNGSVTYLGNPGVAQSKTVAYELGYEHSLFNMYLLKIAAYYKDVTNQPAYTTYESTDGSVHYQRITSDNYADIRGVELTVQKRLGKWISGFVNYTYEVTTTGYFGLRYHYQDPQKMRNYLRENPYQTKPHPRPYARANIDFHTPNDFGPRLMGLKPLASWQVNFLASWKTGSYATYNPNNTPGVKDNVQWKDSYNIDLRFGKRFQLSNNSSVQLYVDISNLLNTKFLSYAGFSGADDYQNYLASLNLPFEEGEFKGNDRIGEYRSWDTPYDPIEPLIDNPTGDPSISAHNNEIKQRNNHRRDTKSYIDMPNQRAFTFLNPRDITIGIKFDF